AAGDALDLGGLIGEGIENVADTEGSRGEELGNTARADVPRTHRANAQTVEHLIDDAQLPGPDGPAGAVVAEARGAVEFELLETGNISQQRDDDFAEAFLH